MPRSVIARAAGLLLAGSFLAACSESADTLSAPAESAAASARTSLPEHAVIAQSVAALRRATAPYHDIATAIADDFATPVTPCWYHGDLGAMGYHYADVTRLDGVIDSLAPEALVYEPLAGGKMALVAVEYIVPISEWRGEGRPTLFGRAFDENTGLGLYVLHVWAWRDNPAGLFAPWNPRVSCQYAAESEDRGHTH